MNKRLIGSLIIVFIVVIIEYLCYTLFIDVEKSYDKAKAKELVGTYFTNSPVATNNVFKTNMSEKYKLGLAINNVEEKFTEYDCNELYKDNEKDSGGIIVAKGAYCDGSAQAISYAGLEKAYKKLFGNEAKLSKERVDAYDYIAEKDIFVMLSCRCGNTDVTKYLYDVKDAKIKDNTLKVKVYYYEYVPEEGKENEEIDEAKVLEENKSKATIYEMKFKKENKVFKLISVKKVS